MLTSDSLLDTIKVKSPWTVQKIHHEDEGNVKCNFLANFCFFIREFKDTSRPGGPGGLPPHPPLPSPQRPHLFRHLRPPRQPQYVPAPMAIDGRRVVHRPPGPARAHFHLRYRIQCHDSLKEPNCHKDLFRADNLVVQISHLECNYPRCLWFVLWHFLRLCLLLASDSNDFVRNMSATTVPKCVQISSEADDDQEPSDHTRTAIPVLTSWTASRPI